MIAKVLNARMVDKGKVTRKVPLSSDDPRKICCTIAEVAPDKSTDIHKRKMSRFQRK